MTLREREHTMLRQIDKPGTEHILLRVLIYELVKVNCLVSNIRRALLVGINTKGVATFYHVRRAEAETQDIIFRRLSWTLSVTFSIN